VPGGRRRGGLAHVVKNKIEAAYRRAIYLDERTALMSRWPPTAPPAGVRKVN